MNIAQHDLARQLKQQSALLYLISGDEILLMEESVNLILAKARTEGYEERIIIEAEISEAPDHFLSHRQNFSLFSTKKIIEVRFRQKIPAVWANLLNEMATNIDPNQVIILRFPKLSCAETQQKWYKAIEQKGWTITLWPLKQENFLRWLQSRFEALGMKTDRESYALIAANTEGNLLAASQIVEKLHLMHGNTSVSHSAIQQALSDHSHYDVFELCDAALNQNPQKCLKILFNLKKQGSEPAIILWALMQDLRKLAILSTTPPALRSAVYQKQGIWSTRQALFQKALNQFNQSLLQQLIQKARVIDEIIKGAATGNIWIDIEEFCLSLAGITRNTR